MKDTYWYVVAAFGIVAAGAWLGVVLGRLRVERLIREGRFGTGAPKSIWTRDLLDNPVGRFLQACVLPPLILASGFIDIVSGHAKLKYFDYQGFDATCIGAGKIGMGVVWLSAFTFPAKVYGESGLRTAAIWAGLACFVAGFSVALFRNI
jgi:hypothetical protein